MLALRGRRAELSAPVKVQDISEHPFPGLPPKWYKHTHNGGSSLANCDERI